MPARPETTAAGSVARSSAVSQIFTSSAPQVRRHDVADRVADGFDAARMLFLPFAQHRGDLLPLQMLLRSAEIARDDRKAAERGKAGEIALADIH